MKKLLLLLLLLLTGSLMAQRRNYWDQDSDNYTSLVDHGQPEHALLVRPVLKFMGGECLEVTTNYGNLLMKPLSGIPPKMGSIITEVNGNSTKGMSPGQFYQLIDNASKVDLKYRDNNTEQAFSYSKVHYQGRLPIIRMLVPKKNEQVRIYRDNDIDFTKYRTYDYLLTDVKEKDVAQEFMAQVDKGMLPLKRDVNNPDLLIKVSLDESRNVSSTYVPPTTRVENLGSTTTQRYSYLTNRVYFETQNDSRVVREGDYTRTTVTNQFYFEVAFLDTKLMNDTKLTIAPVVWSLTYKEVVEGNYDIFTQANKIIKEFARIFPRTLNESVNYLYITGICFDDKGNIADILPGSNADKVGIKVGDELLNCTINGDRYKNWEKVLNNAYPTYWHAYTIKRGREKIELKVDVFATKNAVPILNVE